MNVENYRTYFWIKNESAASGRIYVKKNNSSAPTLSIQYSTDLSNWTTLSNTSTTARYVTADAGQKVYFRATAEKWADLSSGFYYNYFYSASGVTHSVGGNIMSLLYGANFVGQTTFPNEDVFGIFNGLFVGDTDLISAGELVLPVTHIESTTGYMGRCCYRSMFSNCSNLEYGPQVDLRFRDINNPIELYKCMQGFLQYCSKLKTIHVCLQNCNDCFDVIFAGAEFEGLTWYDYSGKPMDSFPQNVTCVPVISMYLPTYDRVIDWYSSWNGRIYQVDDSNNVTIYKYNKPSTASSEFYIQNTSNTDRTFVITCVEQSTLYQPTSPEVSLHLTFDGGHIGRYASVGGRSNRTITVTLYPNEKCFIVNQGTQGWTNTDNTQYYCYFSSSETSPCFKIGGKILSLYTSDYQVSGIYNLPDYCFSKLFMNMTALEDASEVTFNDTISSIKIYGGEHCFFSMFDSCTNLVYAPEVIDATAKKYGFCGMFYGCTSLKYGPTSVFINGTTANNLASHKNMFNGCTSLTTAPVVFLGMIPSESMDRMFNGCSSLGYLDVRGNNTFTGDYIMLRCAANGRFRLSNGAVAVRGVDGIPTSWSQIS